MQDELVRDLVIVQIGSNHGSVRPGLPSSRKREGKRVGVARDSRTPRNPKRVQGK